MGVPSRKPEQRLLQDLSRLSACVTKYVLDVFTFAIGDIMSLGQGPVAQSRWGPDTKTSVRYVPLSHVSAARGFRVSRLPTLEVFERAFVLAVPNSAEGHWSLVPLVFSCGLTATLLDIRVEPDPWVNHGVQQFGGRRGACENSPPPATWLYTVHPVMR